MLLVIALIILTSLICLSESLMLWLPQLPSVCLWLRWTGIECPGCGLTRSVLSFFSGQWSQSFYFHPLGPLLCLLLIGWVVVAGASAVSGAPWKIGPALYGHLLRHRLLVISIILTWGILRNF